MSTVTESQVAAQSNADFITITILPVTEPRGKLAEAEVVFTSGPLAGLKLIGFAVWQQRSGVGRNVTFPSRTYSVNGERRSCSLLRPTGRAESTPSLRDAILAAYAAVEHGGES